MGPLIEKLTESTTPGDPLDLATTFIKKLEGFSAKPYWDHKQWSWGYGTKVPNSTNSSSVKPTATVSERAAEIYLKDYITKSFSRIKGALKKGLRTSQYVALLSFDYNLGFGNTLNLITRINAGKNDAEVAAAFKLYNLASGKVLPALVTRRNKEAEKFTA